ncbi:MAG: hypothetical protein Q8K75_03020 [Chlamydiales bacterium]|nr:hypothetical protein [Chlamydiales bacterium]
MSVDFSSPSISASGETFSAKGKVIDEGTSTNRVAIKGIEDSRMRIVAKTITESKQSGFLTRLVDKIKYIKVKGADGDKIYLNIGSLSRLGISSSEARSASKAGNLENLIQERAPQMKAKLEKYDAVLNKYSEDKQEMRSKDGGIATGLSKQELQKVIRIGLTQVTAAGKVLSFSKAQVLVQQTNGEHPRIIAKPMDSTLGSGSFGVVHKVVDVFGATTHAMKLAKLEINVMQEEADHNYKAIKDVKNEAKLLSYIGLQRGVQRPPSHQAFAIDKAGWVGFVGHLYSCSLSEVKPFLENKTAGMECGHQLFCGLAVLEEKGVILGDVKGGNILVTLDEQTGLPKEVGLADLGGAKKTKDLNLSKLRKSPLGTKTPGHYTKLDETKAREAAQNDNKTRFVELQHKRDVFATTQTLLRQITGVKPFETTSDGYARVPSDTKYLKALSDHGYPDEVVNFFKKNLSDDPDERSTPQQALKEYEGIMSRHFPALYDKLKSEGHLRQA